MRIAPPASCRARGCWRRVRSTNGACGRRGSTRSCPRSSTRSGPSRRRAPSDRQWDAGSHFRTAEKTSPSQTHGTHFAAEQAMRDALRILRRSPGFAGIVILTLAVAIGATTSVFSVVRGLLLKPLPFREPEQLVRFYGSWKQFAHGPISLSEFHNDYESV